MTHICTCCQTPLTGSLDTFGEVDAPMCWPCWSTLVFEPRRPFDDIHPLTHAELLDAFDREDEWRSNEG